MQYTIILIIIGISKIPIFNNLFNKYWNRLYFVLNYRKLKENVVSIYSSGEHLLCFNEQLVPELRTMKYDIVWSRLLQYWKNTDIGYNLSGFTE